MNLLPWSLVAILAVASGQIGEITVTYEGTEVIEGETYKFGQFGTLECSVDSNSEDITYTWTNVNGEESIDSNLLIIGEEMVDAEGTNIWRCVVTDTEDQETQNGPEIDFTAVGRVEGKAPTRDVTYIIREGEDLPQIPCQIPPGSQGQSLQWNFRLLNGESETVYSEGDVVRGGYSIVEGTFPDDGHRNLVIQEPASDKVGVYECVVGQEIIGSVEFMLISEPSCPSADDVFQGKDAKFVCGVTIQGSVVPKFTWSREDLISTGQAEDAVTPGEAPFEHEIESTLLLSNAQVGDRAIEHLCSLEFVGSEFSEAEPAGHVEICKRPLNDNYVDNIQVTYADVPLVRSERYRLGTGEALVCSADSFPEDAVLYRWLTVDGIQRTGPALEIEEWMEDITQFACIAQHIDDPSIFDSLILNFDVFIRAQGDVPTQDLAGISLVSDVEIPCRKPNLDDILQWIHTDYQGERSVVYSSDNPVGISPFYRVPVSLPDDGVRNLVFVVMNGTLAGFYTCEINGDSAGMVEVSYISDIQCPNPRDVFPADDVSFSCTATITGSVEPRFQWMTNEVLDLGSDITIPNQPSPPSTRQRQNDFIRANIDETFHTVTHQCNIDLPTSTSGAQPAGLVATCDAAVNVRFTGDITVTYEGIALTGENTYRLGQFGTLTCSAESYPDSVRFIWTDASDPFGETSVESNELVINAEMVAAEGTNTWRCVVINMLNRDIKNGPDIAFTAVRRVAGKLPTQDLAYVTGGEEPQIPCQIPLDMQGENLQWRFRTQEGDDEIVYDDSEPENPEDGYNVAQVTDPDDGHRNLVIEDPTADKVGVYVCIINDTVVGSVEFMFISELSCSASPEEVFQGESAGVVCGAQVLGTVAPQVTWYREDLIDPGQGEDVVTQETPFRYEIESTLQLGNLQASDHAIEHGCDLQFVESEFSGALPADRVEICKTSVNVKHVANIEVTYAGFPLIRSERYFLGTGGILECSVDVYPEEAAEYRWVAVGFQSLEETLEIEDWMEDITQLACIVQHNESAQIFQSRIINFDVLVREQGNQPTRNIAERTDNAAEIPCRREDINNLLEWYFIPFDSSSAEPEDQLIYSSASHDATMEGYTVYATFPDDGQRNLIIDEVTLDKAGRYECRINDVVAGNFVQVTAFDPVQCSTIPDLDNGDPFNFECSVSFAGARENPDYSVRCCGEEEPLTDLPEPIESCDGEECSYTLDLVDQEKDYLDHNTDYICEISFTEESPSNGLDPAVYTDSCSSLNRVIHLEDVRVTFGGDPINTGFTLPQGALLRCEYVSFGVTVNEIKWIVEHDGNEQEIPSDDGTLIIGQEEGLVKYSCAIQYDEDQEARSEEVEVGIASFVVPVRDIADWEGEDISIECDIGSNSGGERELKWWFQAYDDSDPVLIYSTDEDDEDDVQSEGYEISDDHDLSFVLSAATAGYYRCQLIQGLTNTGDIGRISVMMIETLSCPPTDLLIFNDGDTDEDFDCSVRIHGPVDPQFEWTIADTDFGPGTTEEQSSALIRTVSNTLIVPIVTGDYHQVNNLCGISFTQGSLPHVAPAEFNATCDWDIDVRYIRAASLQYGGEPLQPGTTYELGLGGEVVCVVDAFPVEFVQVTFPSFDVINMGLSSDSGVAGTFPIGTDLTDGSEHEIACVAIHTQLRMPRQSDRIRFTAFDRALGALPNQDVATIEGSPVPELPCAMEEGTTSLRWTFGESDVYSSENGVEEGYEVRLTNPDDGVRNLRITEMTGEKAGIYKCERNGEPAGTVEVFYVSDVDCSNSQTSSGSSIGDDATITCRASFVGDHFDPEFTWTRDGVDIESESNLGENGDIRVFDYVLEDLQGEDHAVPHVCNIDFPASGDEVLEAETLEACDTSVNVIHLGEIEVMLNGMTALDESIRYVFATGAELLCSASGFPETDIQVHWVEILEDGSSSQRMDNPVLVIDDSMAGSDSRTFDCVAQNLQIDAEDSLRITFTSIFRGEGILPVQDVAVQPGTADVFLPCRRDDVEDTLSWHFTSTSSGVQEQVFSTDTELVSSSSYRVPVTLPDDNIRDLVIVTVTTDLAGIYECRINNQPVGAVALIVVENPACEPIEDTVYEQPLEVRCSAEVIGDVNPAFTVMKDGVLVGQFPTDDPETGIVYEEIADPEDHEAEFTCSVMFEQSVGIEPAVFEGPSCTASSNIIHLGEVSLRYGGNLIEEGMEPVLGLGGTIECQATGYPQDIIDYRWVAGQRNLRAKSLEINEEMVERSENTLTCFAIHGLLLPESRSAVIEFTAVGRAIGNAPLEDLVVRSDANRGELPCAPFIDDGVLIWTYTPLGTGSPTEVYNSETGALEPGYDVFITTPDDNVRNLIIQSVDEDTVGYYECTIGNRSDSVAVSRIGPAVCSSVDDGLDGSELEFTCSTTILGPVNPQVTVSLGDTVLTPSETISEPPPDERPVEAVITENANWQIHHENAFNCEIDFSETSDVGSQASSYSDSCSTNLEIIHLGDIAVRLGDTIIPDGSFLPIDSTIVCSSVSFFPSDAVTFSWQDIDGEPIGSGANLQITDEFSASVPNEVVCVGDHDHPEIEGETLEFNFLAAAFVLPSNDIAAIDGDTVSIECSVTDSDLLLEWVSYSYDDNTEEIIYNNQEDEDVPRVDGYAVTRDGAEYTLLFTLNEERAKYYSCRIEGSAAPRIAVMLVELACPQPDDVTDGATDVIFSCSADVYGPVDPELAWVFAEDVQFDAEAQTSGAGTRRTVTSDATVELVDYRELHSARVNDNQCTIAFEESSASGVTAATYTDFCNWNVNVNHIESVVMEYEGNPLQDGEDYTLGTGGELFCGALGYPLDGFTYQWESEVPAETVLGQTLEITDELADGESNLRACVVEFSEDHGLSSRESITFAARQRTQGNAPVQNGISVEGSPGPELPCRIPNTEPVPVLTWTYQANGASNSEVVFNSETNQLEDGYSVFITNPDDGVRNLLIEDASRPGTYSCNIDDDPAGRVEVYAATGIECSENSDTHRNELIQFNCSAEFSGDEEPQFQWQKNGVNQPGGTLSEPQDRRYESFFIEDSIQVADHQVPYACRAMFDNTETVTLCETSVNVFHLENVRVTYSGRDMNVDSVSNLASGMSLDCSFDAYPEEFVQWGWLEAEYCDDPEAATEHILAVNTSFPITSDMAENAVNTICCTAALPRLRIVIGRDAAVSSKPVEFTVFARGSNLEAPEVDVAVSAGERVEIPCRRIDETETLLWYYSATGNAEDREEIYSTDEPDHVEPGYEIQVTEPDDQQRNLIILALTGATAGSYTCEIRGFVSDTALGPVRNVQLGKSVYITDGKTDDHHVRSTTVSVMSVDGPICAVTSGGAQEGNALIGAPASYVCTLAISGPAVPSFEWRDNNDEPVLGFLAGGGPTYTYIHTRTVTVDMHEEPFTCEVSLEPTGEMEPAVLEEPTCSSTITILPSIEGISITNNDEDISGMVNFVLGVDQTLECTINTFEMEAEFQWVRNSNLGPATIDGATFTVTEAMVDRDNGDVTSYTCQVRESNGNGEVLESMDAVFVSAILQDEITLSYEGQILEGSTIEGDVETGTEIECSVADTTFPFAEFRWVKQSGPGPDEVITTNRFDHSNFLTITSEMIGESGESAVYWCMANNGALEEDLEAEVEFTAVPFVSPDVTDTGYRPAADVYILYFLPFIGLLAQKFFI